LGNKWGRLSPLLGYKKGRVPLEPHHPKLEKKKIVCKVTEKRGKEKGKKILL